MRTTIAIISLVIGFSTPLGVSGQVPDQFIGLWSVHHAKTTEAISADPDMYPDNKPGWTQRWLAPGIQLEIAETSITFRSSETGEIDISIDTATDLEDHTTLSAAMKSPSGQDEMKLTIELRMTDSGEMNFRIQEENDFDLVFWERSENLPAESIAEAPGTIVDYLDSLVACKPGEFRLNYPGLGSVQNTIMGSEGDRCRVRSQTSQVQMMCNFSVETIALLTSEVKYEEARTGVLSGSTSSDESKRMELECRVE